MNPRSDETQAEAAAFDFSAFPADTLVPRPTDPARGSRAFRIRLNAAGRPHSSTAQRAAASGGPHDLREAVQRG